MRVGNTIKPVNAGEVPISLNEEEEKRLIRLGVAVKVSENIKSELVNEKKRGKITGAKNVESEIATVLVPDAMPDLDASDAIVDADE